MQAFRQFFFAADAVFTSVSVFPFPPSKAMRNPLLRYTSRASGKRGVASRLLQFYDLADEAVLRKLRVPPLFPSPFTDRCAKPVMDERLRRPLRVIWRRTVRRCSLFALALSDIERQAREHPHMTSTKILSYPQDA